MRRAFESLQTKQRRDTIDDRPTLITELPYIRVAAIDLIGIGGQGEVVGEKDTKQTEWKLLLIT